MAEQKKGTDAVFGLDIDFYTIIRDILKNWWMILALAIAASLISYVQVNKSYSPSYTIEATYVVTANGINNSVYDNLTTAQDTAVRFSQILNSPALQSKVSEDLGSVGVPGVVSAQIVPETNLLVLKVQSGSPEMAYRILRSVMDNYPTISDYMVGNAILDVLMEPVIPTGPNNQLSVKRPVMMAFLATAAVLMLILGVISYLKDTIRKSSDVEKKLDVRLLGSLCHEVKNKTLSSKIHRMNSSLLITNPVISFRYAELTQKLCHKVQNRMEQIGAKSLLVTSCMENEGKSTAASNIALTLMRGGKKVVLVDLDLRNPSQFKMFGLEDQEMKEFGAALNGEKYAEGKLVQQLENGLYTIFNTVEYVRSTEMLTTGVLETILEFLKEKFDYVIVDTPPMGYVADTEVIAGMVDASLLVVREHVANAKSINDVLDVLSGCRAEVIGCAFNDAHKCMIKTLFGIHSYGKDYGYGKYYGNRDN